MRRIQRIAAGLAIASAAGAATFELRAQPTRPPPSREQVAQMAAKRQAFCDGVLKLGALAKTNFRSIQKGFVAGSDIFHESAMTLPDAKDCTIATVQGTTAHTCSFPATPQSLAAATRGIANLTARCLNVPPPKVESDEMGDPAAIITGGVRYAIQSNDFGENEPVDVSLAIETAK